MRNGGLGHLEDYVASLSHNLRARSRFPELANFSRILIWQSTSALPSGSDVNLLSDSQSVIDFYTEVPDGAFNLGMTKQQRDGP